MPWRSIFLLDWWKVTSSSIPWNGTTISFVSRQRRWSSWTSPTTWLLVLVIVSTWKPTNVHNRRGSSHTSGWRPWTISKSPRYQPMKPFSAPWRMRTSRPKTTSCAWTCGKTMNAFLVWYNNKDVEPMLEDINKMFQFNQNRCIDMFKDGISVSGLVLKYMFQDLPDYFTVPDEKNKDLYDLYKNNIVARASSSIATTRKTRPSYDLPSTQIQSPVSWFMV